jgi:hypothetical protein
MPSKALPHFVIEALMAIAYWQSSQSTPSRCSTGGLQQLEDLQSWQGAFQRDMIGAMTDPVKVSLALELAASLTGQAQLSALDMLKQCPREVACTPLLRVSLTYQVMRHGIIAVLNNNRDLLWCLLLLPSTLVICLEGQALRRLQGLQN